VAADPQLIDAHGHLLPEGLPDLGTETGDGRWPRLVVEGDTGRIMRGTALFRRVRRSCWDVGQRLGEMDERGIGVQVISPVPVTLVDWAEPRLAARWLAAQNDRIAEAVAGSGGRLAGLGGLPLQEPELALAELRRVTVDLGLAGVEIGTLNGGAELDDPRLRPVLWAAAEQGVPLFVHPVDGAGATRCGDPAAAFGLGMLTDTALAARALVFGDLLAELPDLRVHLAHGGGTFPYAYPRLRTWAAMRDEGPPPDVLEERVRRLHVDTLVFDPALLRLCVERYGAERVMFGSDDPFIPWDAVIAPLDAAGPAVRSGNAAAFYGIDVP
jgi:aminocarboxymuconate-semialdehyde decarboxylase